MSVLDMKKIFLNLFMYGICGGLLVFYLFSFSLLMKNDFTYSYKMYYIEAKTKYWHGYEGLNIEFGKYLDYSNLKEIDDNISTENLQYFGKDFKFVYEKFYNKNLEGLSEVQIDNHSSLYFEIKDDINIKYKIRLWIEDRDTSSIGFILNGTEIESVSYDNEEVILEIQNAERENVLVINSKNELKLLGIRFDKEI